MTYIIAIYKKTTKPHSLTWIGAGLMSGIAWAIQVQNDAGPTIWVTGVVTLFCIGIGIAAIWYGEKNITKSDWISFFIALSVIPIWLMTNNPYWAIVLVLMIELLNYYPTVRKSYFKPWEEDIVSWSLSALRWFFATLAVTTISFEALAYPLFITTCEVLFVAYLVIRRKSLQKVIAT